MRIHPIIIAAICAPSIGLAVGSDSETPPAPTQTSTDCKAGQIYDAQTKKCLDAKSELLDDDLRYEAVRELAYGGQYDRARLVLSSMTKPSESRVLTYHGFIARKTGDMQKGVAYYVAALEADADNILARSYLGQALVELGQTEAATLQLAEIRNRGGTGSWAERALSQAITTGTTHSY